MNVERLRHCGWPEAYRCSAGPVELIVVASMGPRILSLRLQGGENLLYEDTTDFKVGAWRLCGGHRFATAPESPMSYTPDNQPCEVSFECNRLSMSSCLEDGLLRGLEITTDMHSTGFELRHVLRNCRTEPWRGAAWAITCVPLSGRVIVPRSNGPARFWTGPDGGYADASSLQWQSLEDCFVIQPRGHRGKVGLRSEPGWLAWLLDDCTFIIRGPARRPQATYPDGDCNVEVYTSATYLELETLGPLTTLLPGEALAHVERWQLAPRAFSPSAWRALDEFIQPSGTPICADGVTA
jgi:hypothetical protein